MRSVSTRDRHARRSLTPEATILWRRLDTPGHDGCRLLRHADGWEVEGAAVFREGGAPARLAYRLVCDAAWRTVRGEVHGWLDAREVDYSVARSPEGQWALNGQAVPHLETCVDLDLGFTPATNLTQLRRIALAEGQAADVPVAWLDIAAGTLTILEQRYERRSDSTYWYEAPPFDYRALLEVDASGFVRRYPGLWEPEP